MNQERDIMTSRSTQDVAELYTRRHQNSRIVFANTDYANYGYWTREGMRIEEACAALTDLVAGAAGIGPDDRVLDVGCGYGAGIIHYARRYQPGLVIGIDVTEVRLEHAREVMARSGLADRVQIRFGDATALDFDAGSFHHVIAVECAFHFHTRQDFFREAARVLVPGGSLALTDMIPRRGVDYQEFRSRVYPIGTGPEFNVAENVYDADTYEEHLRSAGFDEVSIKVITDRTLPRFVDHLERLGHGLPAEKASLLHQVAQRYREHLDSGLEYILVAARRANRH
jgi:cyclopropane fatty-acyl-phospholipid synthase-like methyltransferase